MKKYISGLTGSLLVIFLILALVILPSCSRNFTAPPSSPSGTASSLTAATAPPPGNPASTELTNPGKGTMSARVDGKAWTAAAITAFDYSTDILSIKAKSSNPEINIAFTVLNEGPGTYRIGPQSPGTNAVVTIGTSIWQADPFMGSGTITYTAMTPQRASGTFSFTVVAAPGTPAKGTKSVTDGVFNITPSKPGGR